MKKLSELKKTIGTLLIVIIGCFVVGGPLVYAQSSSSSVSNPAPFIGACTGPKAIAANTTVCKDVQKQSSSKSNLIINLIKDVINIVSVAVGIAAVIIIVISGLRMALSGGDSKAVTEAKNGILGAVIGIVVVVLAQSFVIFVLDRIN